MPAEELTRTRKEDRPGCIERAHGGILFLDEIEDLPYEIQGKLLRVIESGEFLPVGSDHLLHSRFQLISASNIDIEGLTLHRSFRLDLYHRITPIIIRIPPLRGRGLRISPFWLIISCTENMRRDR